MLKNTFCHRLSWLYLVSSASLFCDLIKTSTLFCSVRLFHVHYLLGRSCESISKFLARLCVISFQGVRSIIGLGGMIPSHVRESFQILVVIVSFLSGVYSSTCCFILAPDVEYPFSQHGASFHRAGAEVLFPADNDCYHY